MTKMADETETPPDQEQAVESTDEPEAAESSPEKPPEKNITPTSELHSD